MRDAEHTDSNLNRIADIDWGATSLIEADATYRRSVLSALTAPVILIGAVE
jgi:hypothetical protein